MTVPPKRRAVVGALLVFTAMMMIFGLTRAPSVTFIDSGELASVASILGIAHPTGYPLFTLLGRLVVMLPLGGEEIVRLNVFASLVTALAVGVAYWLMLELITQTRSARRPAQVRPVPSWMQVAVAGSGALVVGTSTTVWAQAVAIEVYALHLLLISLVLVTFLAGLDEQLRASAGSGRLLVLSAFLLGLAFSNHLTTVLLLPGLAYLYGATLSLARPSLKRLAKLAPWFALGLTPYGYVMIRSAAVPPLDWGHPATMERFLWHVSGKQYRSWIFSSMESAERQLGYFIDRLPQEYWWGALMLAGLGMVVLWKRRRRLFWFLVILFVSCVAYAINYDIHDIDSYFLLAFVVIGCVAAVGASRLADLLSERWGRAFRIVVPVAVLAVAVLQVGLHRSAVDQSDNYLVEDYTTTILESVDSNAVIISYQWDYFVSASLYYQNVRHRRTDVLVIDKELLRRSWYYTMLEQRAPWLVERCRSSIERFLGELDKFEHGLPYGYEAIETSFNAMINDMIAQAMRDRAVYVGPEIEPQFAVGLERVPAGLLFKLRRPDSAIPALGSAQFDIRPTRYRDPLVDGLRFQCAKMLVFKAFWLVQRGDDSEALKALDLAASYRPSMPEIADLRSRIMGRMKGEVPGLPH